MQDHRPATDMETRTRDPRADDSALDHALTLALADDKESALRWGAAALESAESRGTALLLTCRILDQMGRKRTAASGMALAVEQAVRASDLPLAAAAIGDLRECGVDASKYIEQVANAFCLESSQRRPLQHLAARHAYGDFQPLTAFLTGGALTTKAADLVEGLRRRSIAEGESPPTDIAPAPLFSELSHDALRDVLAALRTLTVPAGEIVLQEGAPVPALFVIARGELEVTRQDEDGRTALLTTLKGGACFGEMAMMSSLVGAFSVTATRPSILLAVSRGELESLVARHPTLAVALPRYCRERSVANLGTASSAVISLPPEERGNLVDKFETRLFEEGQKLAERGKEVDGLFLILAGEVVLVADDDEGRLELARLKAGDTVGEAELVLCQRSLVDVVATRSTATLFVPRDEFFSLVLEHPAVLHGLYGVAVRRHVSTSLALDAGAIASAAEGILEEMEGRTTTMARKTLPLPDLAPAALRPASVPKLAVGEVAPLPSVPPPLPVSATPSFSTITPPPFAQGASPPASTAPGTGASSTPGPIRGPSSIGPTSHQPSPPPHSRPWGQFALVAAAAAAIGFVVMRDHREALSNRQDTALSTGVASSETFRPGDVGSAEPTRATPSASDARPSASADGPSSKSATLPTAASTLTTPAVAPAPMRKPSAQSAAGLKLRNAALARSQSSPEAGPSQDGTPLAPINDELSDGRSSSRGASSSGFESGDFGRRQ